MKGLKGIVDDFNACFPRAPVSENSGNRDVSLYVITSEEAKKVLDGVKDDYDFLSNL
jgi:hypothetical protein